MLSHWSGEAVGCHPGSATFSNLPALRLQLPAVWWGDQVLFIACFFEE